MALRASQEDVLMKEFLLGIIASFGVQSIPCEANGVTGIYDTVIKLSLIHI